MVIYGLVPPYFENPTRYTNRINSLICYMFYQYLNFPYILLCKVVLCFVVNHTLNKLCNCNLHRYLLWNRLPAAKWAHDGVMTSYRRRCDVITSHRSQCGVMCLQVDVFEETPIFVTLLLPRQILKRNTYSQAGVVIN